MSAKQSFRQGAWAPDRHNKYQRARKQLRRCVKAANAAGVTLRKFGAGMSQLGNTFRRLEQMGQR